MVTKEAESDSAPGALARKLAGDPSQAHPLNLGDRYAIDQEIGRGGFGRVFLAHDRRLARDVAIKVLVGPYDEIAIRRFELEARAAGALQHPNVLVIHDIGEAASGVPYVVSELLKGSTLREKLRNGPLSATQALDYAMQLAQGLGAAHHSGIIHRDLKPENVFVTAGGAIKILDFGIAKLASATKGKRGDLSASLQTEAGAILGTVAYMSPEQVRGAPVDHRSDLFSYGIIVYEMLAGRGPFEGKTDLELAGAILHEPAAPLPAKISPRLSRFVFRCLEKRLEDRFQCVHDVLSDLRELTGARRARGVRAAAPPPASVAVLPLVDLSPDKDQEYLGEGIAEEIMIALGRIAGLRVVGRTSSFSFKGKRDRLPSIARKLRVRTLLEGSIRKAGDHIRVTTQLVDAADGCRLWSATYERELRDIFSAQGEIARAVAEALEIKLVPGQAGRIDGRRTLVPEAYDHYLLGRQHCHRARTESIRLAIGEFERALGLDPDYALAWAWLSYSTNWWASDSTDIDPADLPGARRRALEAANRAIALAPDLADGFLARGAVRSLDFDWTGGRADLDRALSTAADPVTLATYAFSALRPLGRFEDAIAFLRKAVDIDPLSAKAWKDLGVLHLQAGELEAAHHALTTASKISPALDLASLGHVFLVKGDPASALEIYLKLHDEAERLEGAALAFHDLGRATESDRALGAAIAKYARVDAYQIAEIHAWRGDVDEAFRWLDHAYAQRDGGLLGIVGDRLIARIRSDPRYVAFLRKMNLPG